MIPDRMADVVAPLGYAPVTRPRAPTLLSSTPAISAKKRPRSCFPNWAACPPAKRKSRAGERMIVAVAGCVAQAEGAEIQRRAPYVDMVFGPQTYHQLPEMIARIARGAGRFSTPNFRRNPNSTLCRDSAASRRQRFFIGAGRLRQILHFLRRALYARRGIFAHREAIVAEAEHLVDSGAREITLLGQNVNAFHGEGEDGKIWGLGRLLHRLAEIQNFKRLRYMTSHPRDMDDELIAAHRDLPQLMPFLHLPVQSGSDAILEAMNRRHKADDYRRIIDKLRTARPDIALSSDFIVGFPGETDADHAATMQLAREIGFAQAYSFKYSRRPGTPAAAMTNQIAEDVKDARLQELQTLLRAQQDAFNQSLVGKTLPVLFDGPRKNKDGLSGQTEPWPQPFHAIDLCRCAARD